LAWSSAKGSEFQPSILPRNQTFWQLPPRLVSRSRYPACRELQEWPGIASNVRFSEIKIKTKIKHSRQN